MLRFVRLLVYCIIVASFPFSKLRYDVQYQACGCVYNAMSDVIRHYIEARPWAMGRFGRSTYCIVLIDPCVRISKDNIVPHDVTVKLSIQSSSS